MQKAYQPNFKNRSISYVASRISSQARKQREIRQTRTGEHWRYDLNPVYIIALLNFSFDHEEDYPEEKHISNYMKSLYAESDYANTIEYAEKMGEARGEERGIAIGEERGIAKREVQNVAAMLEKRMDIEMICEITGLTPDEVNALK